MPSARSYEVISENGAAHSKAHGISVLNVGFTEADEAGNFKFEPTQNYDPLISGLLAQYGVAGALARLEVRGDPAGDFKLIWDYIDDNYSYYNVTINKYAVDLALEYAKYLRDGGDPLTDVVAKYTPDGADAGTAPDRVQSMHDNILGNLDVNSIIDKFFDGNATNGSPDVPAGYVTGGSNGGSNGVADELTGQALLDQVFAADLDGRPYYGGYEGTDPTPTHGFDLSHGLLVL